MFEHERMVIDFTMIVTGPHLGMLLLAIALIALAAVAARIVVRSTGAVIAPVRVLLMVIALATTASGRRVDVRARQRPRPKRTPCAEGRMPTTFSGLCACCSQTATSSSSSKPDASVWSRSTSAWCSPRASTYASTGSFGSSTTTSTPSSTRARTSRISPTFSR